MTIIEFLEQIDTNDKWKITRQGFIRDSKDRCPIIHVSNGIDEDNEIACWIGETKLLLSPQDSIVIINSSDVDLTSDVDHTNLRNRILNRCNPQQEK